MMTGSRRRARWTLLLAVAVLGGVAACDESATGPAQEGVPEGSLQFLTMPSDLQPLETRDTSFWAVRGEDSQLVIRYVPEAGATEGEEFLTFRVRAQSLYRKPNGDPFAPGDSIEIHVTIDDTGRFLFDFEPSGLEFNPNEPAELEIEYRRLNGDLDDDGDVDDDDIEIEQSMRLWKQEAPGALWFPVGTIILEETDEIEGVIDSFTGFAVAV
ncbi:MAG: hypothetical protein ACN0LA_13080 [Candidatus Longimicrobiales bacterium M2_2A_002]